MTKTEFCAKIYHASNLLIHHKGEVSLCYLLDLVFQGFDSPARRLFSHYFTPEDICNNIHWLDDCFNDDDLSELERRLLFLDSFREFCLANHSYKNWPPGLF